MNFDEIINRCGTHSTQWDYVQDRFNKSGLLPFTISDMDIQSPTEINNALTKRIQQGISGYTRWDHTDYKGAICHWYISRFQTKIELHWIAYAPAVIYAVGKFLKLVNPKKQGVTIITPCYDGFIKVLNANHYPIHAVPMNDNQIDWKYFEQTLQKSKVLLLCNPNNPNGHLWCEEELQKIVQLCKQYKIFIISDDIHMDFVYKSHRFVPITKIAEQYDYLDNIVIVTSSSKTFNLSGIGGAYLICPNQKLKNDYLVILKEVDSLGSAMALHVDSLIVGYNESALWVDALCDYLYQNLKIVHDFFEANSYLNMSLEIPKSTYFAWINCQNTQLPMLTIQNHLVNKGEVAIMDGDRYCESKAFLRMIIACPSSKVIEGLERIKKSF